MSDKAIMEILGRYGEDSRTATWRVQSSVVIYHKALERIAAKAAIRFEQPTIIRAEGDEAVILVTGIMRVQPEQEAPDGEGRAGVRREWSIGEAKVNVNYRVSGRQAAYVYAMAEKRAKDRVILKLVGLHGLLYSEEEADEFKTGRPANETEPGPEPAAAQNRRTMLEAIEGGRAIETEDGDITADGSIARLYDEFRRKVEQYQTAVSLIKLMQSEEAHVLSRSIGEQEWQELRDYAARKVRGLQEEEKRYRKARELGMGRD